MLGFESLQGQECWLYQFSGLSINELIKNSRFVALFILISIFQLEDSEFAKTAAIKAKQNIELELSDVQQQLDDVLRSKSDLEDKVLRLSREKADLSGQLDDSEEELQEVMKKYKASVSQLSVDQVSTLITFVLALEYLFVSVKCQIYGQPHC